MSNKGPNVKRTSKKYKELFYIAKTELTLQLERQIYAATAKQGTFGCFEVTIGWFGRERVDYMTYDTKGIFRCYEIKVSVSDFRSPAIKSFVGHLNYYVMTKELYEKVIAEIPNEIGVYIGGSCIKRAKKRALLVDEQILKDSMIRSLSRETQKLYKSENPNVINNLNKMIEFHKKEAAEQKRRYQELSGEIYQLYGRNWREGSILYEPNKRNQSNS